MNVRELLARLNVPAIRYDTGRGGVPELTNLDIAGALGMIQDRYHREMFCAVWWPDGAVFEAERLRETVRNKVLREYSERERAAVAAKLDLHIAQEAYATKRHRTEHDRKVLHDCEMALARAKKACWPWDASIYAALFPTVIEELRGPKNCGTCDGRGKVMVNCLVKDCTRCGGSGMRHETKSWRAASLGLKEHQYRNTWGRVYEWLYREALDAEARGAEKFAIAVGRIERQNEAA